MTTVVYDRHSAVHKAVQYPRRKSQRPPSPRLFQATGNVAVAGVRNVLRAQKLPYSDIAKMRIVIAGTSRCVHTLCKIHTGTHVACRNGYRESCCRRPAVTLVGGRYHGAVVDD